MIRRLAAFGLDYLLIVGYLAALAAASVGVLASGLGALYSAAWSTAWSAELLGFLTLTMPVLLYFAILESSFEGATMGKRALGIRVRAVDGMRLGLGRSLVRSAVKFLPWELAHLTIWHYVFAIKAHVQPPGWTLISIGFVYLMVAVYLVTLFVGRSHRTIYDRLAGTAVVLAKGAPAQQ